MSDSVNNFQTRLKNRRVGLELEIEQAAKLMGISEADYREYEEGRSIPPFPQQMSLLIRLNPLDELVIQLQDGEIAYTKGKISASALSVIKDILAANGIQKATVKKYQRDIYHFLSPIPSSLHQRLRNILTQLS